MGGPLHHMTVNKRLDTLGHKKVQITLDLYAHVLPGMQGEAAAKLAALLYL
jgi:hypothetical protein